MERLVYLDQRDDLDQFLEHASWWQVDGLEADLTAMSEDEFLIIQRKLLSKNVPAGSLHYERTNTISLQEWALFESQLRMLLKRADDLDCRTISVHPPKVEKETTNTMDDLRDFVHNADQFAKATDTRLCFDLTGFMKNPQLINIAFDGLENPSLGVMVNLDNVVDGINPLMLLKKLNVDIHKIRFPMSIEEMSEHTDMVDDDVTAVATSLE